MRLGLSLGLTQPMSTLADAPPSGPVLVQQKVGHGDTGTECVVTLDDPVTPGNTLIVGIMYDPTAIDLTDNLIATVLTWPSTDDALGQVSGMPSNGTGVAADIWYKTNLTGGNSDDSIQVVQVNGPPITVVVQEWSGLSDAAPEDSDIANDFNATPSAPGVTPTSANNVIFAVAGWSQGLEGQVYNSGPTNGFTRQIQWDASYPMLESADLIQTSATAKSTAWSLITDSANWATAIAVFGAP